MHTNTSADGNDTSCAAMCYTRICRKTNYPRERHTPLSLTLTRTSGAYNTPQQTHRTIFLNLLHYLSIHLYISVYLLTLILIYLPCLSSITELILKELLCGTMVQWWFYCGTLIYSMPVVLNDYHIYVPWYLNGTPKNTVKLPWYMPKNYGIIVSIMIKNKL